jgi:hypothetical protein
MRKFSKKGAVVFGAALAICAFVMPSMASAASWGVVGSAHNLTATGIGFTAHTPIGALGAQCADAQFNATVSSAAVSNITSTSFTNCTGTGAAAGCAVSATGTNFPWAATGLTTTNVQIHGINIDNFFTGAACPVGNGVASQLTGTLSGGRWTGNGSGQHSITLAAATGLFSHSAQLGTSVATVNDALVVDRQQTLTLT